MSSVLRLGERQLKRLATGLGRTLLRTDKNPPIVAEQVQSILVVRQHNQLGDMLCVVPLLRGLRNRFPACRIVLLTSPVNHEVMKHHRLLDAVVCYDKRAFLGGGRIRTGSLRAFRNELRGFACDLAIVPATVSMSLTSDLLAYISGARWRIGPGSLEGRENPGAFLYTHPVDLEWGALVDRHQTLRNLDVCRDLPITTPELQLEMTLLPLEIESGAREVDSIRRGQRAVVAFHPGAGKVPNRWPAAAFGRVIRELQTVRDASIVIIKGPMDEEPVKALTEMLDCPYYLVESRGIREIASILKSVDLLVSNDTGIMHVGAAVGTRVLSLFGPTDPRQWAPKGPGHRYISSGSGAIAEISADAVLEAALDMLPEHS